MHNDRTAEEIAWAAGLFEGEGCLNAYRRKSGKIQMQLRLAMTDRDIVERFATIVGCGNMHRRHGPAHIARGNKPLFEWYVYEAEKVREVIALLLPFMGERRAAKAAEVLELGADVRSHNAVKTHCPHGHPLEGDNLIEEPISHELVDGTVTHYVARRCRRCRTQQSRARARKRLGIKPEHYRVKEPT